MSDIVVSNGLVIQLFRYTSYLLMIVGLIKKNIKNNNIYWYFGAFVICLGISLITRDVYWCTIILVILVNNPVSMSPLSGDRKPQIRF